MISIPQYENMFSLYLTFIGLVPCIILAVFGKKNRYLDLIVSFLFILSFLGTNSVHTVEFIGFIIYETILVYLYLLAVKRGHGKVLYYCVFVLSMLPLVSVRIISFNTELSPFFGFAGLSYMCFKIWQVLFEIHDGKITELGLLDFLLFLVFFPSFTSGPIARFKEFTESVKSDMGSSYFDGFFVPGIKKIFIGLFYKFALSFYVNEFVIKDLPEQRTFWGIVVYMYAYTMFLFFDFAGYSNIAIGMGKLMGISLPENFNKPFLACNMKEFWTRWHISLSTWFNDYVYGRLVLGSVRSGLIKNTKIAGRVAYLCTMTLMGLWHGFTLHYVIYGLYEGILLVLSDIWVKTRAYRTFRKNKYYNIVCRTVCFQFIAFGMLLFSGKYFFE